MTDNARVCPIHKTYYGKGFAGRGHRRCYQCEREIVKPDLDILVNRFLACPLPASVRADSCVCNPDYPHLRTGTNLLTAEEARTVLVETTQPLLAELATTKAELARAREALSWMLPILQDLAEVPSIKFVPETEHVRNLGERFGYGAVMDAASALWVEVLRQKGYPEGGAISPGVCLGVASLMLKRVHAALAPEQKGHSETTQL